MTVLAGRLRATATVEGVGEILAAASDMLGFAYHALVQHGDYRHRAEGVLFLQNYPGDWVETYARAGFHRHDPAQRLAAARPASFTWRDLPSLLALTPREQRVLDASRCAGLGEGFTVPLHAYGARVASCSFVTRVGIRLPQEALLAAELLARLAYASLFDLIHPEGFRRRLALPERERACVALLAQGKTDWEIGTILGLAEETVTAYLKSARRRFGVTRRTQLAVAALAHGVVGWDEIVTWQYPL